MNRYTIYCTESQTRKALELGAPLEWHTNYPKEIGVSFQDNKVYIVPTAEQMLNWLEEQGTFDEIDVYRYDNDWFFELWMPHRYLKKKIKYPSRQEATLAAIDAALKYLTNNKK